MKLDPNNPDLINVRGQALMKLGQHEDALAAFQRVVAQKPSAADRASECSEHADEAGRLEDALSACNALLATQADYAPGLLMRANVLQHLLRPDGACGL